MRDARRDEDMRGWRGHVPKEPWDRRGAGDPPRGAGAGGNASVGGERQLGPRQRPGNAFALISLCRHLPPGFTAGWLCPVPLPPPSPSRSRSNEAP